MREEPLYKLGTKLITVIYMLVVTVAAFALGGSMIYRSINKTPLDLVTLGIGVFITGCGFVFVWALLKLSNTYIYADRAEVFSVFGNHKYTVLLKNIDSWNEEERKNEGKTWIVLTAYSEAGNINVASTRPNYEAIKTLLTTGKPIAKPREKGAMPMTTALIGYPLMLLGVILFIFTVITFRYCTKPVLPSQLSTFTFCINTQPWWQMGGRGPGTMAIKVDKYPDFTFYVPHEAMPDSAWLFMQNVRKNDSVTISIPTDDYEKKLAQTRFPGLLDMNMNDQSIKVLGLVLRGKNYVSLKAYNNTIFKGVLLIVPFFSSMLALLALLQGYVYIRRGKREAAS